MLDPKALEKFVIRLRYQVGTLRVLADGLEPIASEGVNPSLVAPIIFMITEMEETVEMLAETIEAQSRTEGEANG